MISKTIEFEKGNKKISGMLTSFINEQIADYEEPTRKGTPKGDPIGYSVNKLTAVLMMLTNYPLKEHAKKANVSYGLLRKWRSENNFLLRIDEFASEFFFEYERKITYLMQKANECKTKDEIENIIDSNSEIYSDIEIFSVQLFFKFEKLLNLLMNQSLTIKQQILLNLIIYRALKEIRSSTGESVEWMGRSIEHKFKHYVYQIFESMVSNQVITKRQKEFMYDTLQILKYIEK